VPVESKRTDALRKKLSTRPKRRWQVFSGGFKLFDQKVKGLFRGRSWKRWLRGETFLTTFRVLNLANDRKESK